MATAIFAANGKRDIHSLEHEYDLSFDNLETQEWKSMTNKTVIIEYLRACKKGQAKSGGRNVRVGKSSLYRVLGVLRLLSEKWIDKDFDSAQAEDWQRFYDNMEDDIIINEYGHKYKPATKAKIYKTIRKFLKWKYGQNRQYPDICADWVTTEEKCTKEYLTRPEVEKMVQHAGTSRTKCFVMMLFDGGFRIEELANIRWVDVRKEEGKNFYRAEIRAETSKTKKSRKVSLWLATDYIETYKESLFNEKKYSEVGYLFDGNYRTLYTTIKRIGKRVLNKNISPHTLRHSSATYYASIIKTYQQFCSRYGWALRSNAPQTYFHGVADDEIAGQTKEHEIARFKTEFEQMKVENKHLREVIDKIRLDQSEIAEQIKQKIIKELLVQYAKKEIITSIK
jgi:integrase